MARMTPIKSIRVKCLDCSGGSYKEVTLCPVKDCSLYEYRFGKRPTTMQNKKKHETVTEAGKDD